MNGLTRYIFWQLLTGFMLVAASLTCVIWLTQSLRLVDMIVNNGLSASMFVYLTGLMLPNFLPIILPISIFSITTFAYHRMIIDRELVVMRAAGLGQFNLAKPAILLALLVVAMGYGLTTYLVPTSFSKFKEMKWDARYNFTQVLLKEGTFNTPSRNITVYVRERTEDGRLLGILAHDDRDERHSFTWMSEHGAMVQSDEGGRVVLFNGSRQDFDKKTKQLSILYFDRTVLELAPPSPTGHTRHREARERSMAELIDLDTTGLDNRNIGKFHVELHQRITLPWASLGFVMIALSVLISGSFTRRGEGRRISLAILLAAAYQASIFAIISVAAKNVALIPAIYAVTAVPMVLGGLSLMMPQLFQKKRSETQPPPRPTDGAPA